MLTRQLAMELAPHHIRCNTVKPGLVHTPATEHLYADADVVRRREQIIPTGRISRPRDLAQVIVFLASDRSDYVNAEDIMVDGGVGRAVLTLIPRPEPRQ
jgi:NAD(P)-dependent dehydrogenase (short-subunit alcohol dehydrogenase family)